MSSSPTAAGLLLTGGRLVDGRSVDVTLRDGRIVAIDDTVDGAASAPPVAGAQPVAKLDLDGFLVLPGLVEPHAHLDKALTADRVPNPDGDLMGAIRSWVAHAEAATVADIAERAEVAALQLVANGTTHIRTHVDVGDHVDLRAVDALTEVRERLTNEVNIEITALVASDADAPRQRARLQDALSAGADYVGGCPHLETDGAAFVDRAIDVAGEAGVGLDLHVDETLDPEVAWLQPLAEKVTSTGFEGDVMASHCVSLGMQDPSRQADVAAAVAAAGISVVALPQTNLYLQARGARVAPPRGLTAVAALREAGVNVAAGSDNVQDPFNLVGRGDPLEAAALMVMAGHLGVEDAFASVTSAARDALGAPAVDVVVGAPADLLCIDASTVREAVATAPASRVVVRNGRIVADHRVVRLT